jgi:hypothetical protein
MLLGSGVVPIVGNGSAFTLRGALDCTVLTCVVRPIWGMIYLLKPTSLIQTDAPRGFFLPRESTGKDKGDVGCLSWHPLKRRRCGLMTAWAGAQRRPRYGQKVGPALQERRNIWAIAPCSPSILAALSASTTRRAGVFHGGRFEMTA